MKAALRQAWIDALRSGQYRQGRGFLEDYDGRYCCLGVLCAVAEKTEGRSMRRTDGNGYPRLAGALLYSQDAMRRENAELNWLSVRIPGYEVETGPLAEVLIQLNDVDRASFAYIADFIEANVPVTE